MGMSREEAARFLGVAEDADRTAVNAAYRRCIAKYHPDANRNKSVAERKEAEKLFKKSSEARNIMLGKSEPSKQPDVESAQRSNSTNRPYRYADNNNTARRSDNHAENYGYAPRSASNRTGTDNVGRQYGDDTRAANANRYARTHAGSKASNRQSYSSAFDAMRNSTERRTFRKRVQQAPDDAERQIAGIYESDAESRYCKRTDMLKITPSTFVSIIMIALYVLVSIEDSMRTGSVGIMLNTASTIGCLIVLVKMSTYDMLVSFRIWKKLSRHLSEWSSWLILCGTEIAVLSLMSSVLYGLTGNAQGLFGIISVIGAVCLFIGLLGNILMRKH